MSKEQKNIIVPKLRFPEFRDDGNWQEKVLVDIADKIQDGTHFSPQKFYQSGFLYITSKNVKDGYIELSNAQFISKEDHEEIYKRCDVKKGDVLLTKDGTIGQCCVNELTEQFSLLSSVAFIRLKPNFSNYFLYHLFVSPTGQKEIESQIAGQALTRITLTKINNFHFYFPSFQEQQKIADCLSSLDDLITAENQKLEALQVHRKGLMQQLFPAEGESVPKRRFKEFEGSGEWELASLCGNDIAMFVNEKMLLEELMLESYVSTENMLPDYAGVIISSKLPASGSVTRFKSGDVLLSNIRPYLKKVWFADIDGGASNDVVVIRAGSKINASFLSVHLKNDSFINYIMKGAEGVKMPRGDKDLIKEYPITFPKKEEQQKIAHCLSSVDELITEQAEKIEELKRHKKGLMQGLFPVV
jgi:type I restriction enzyme S subunit